MHVLELSAPKEKLLLNVTRGSHAQAVTVRKPATPTSVVASLCTVKLIDGLVKFSWPDSFTVHFPFVWPSVAALLDPSWFPVGTHLQPVYPTLIPSLPLDCASSWILVYFLLNISLTLPRGGKFNGDTSAKQKKTANAIMITGCALFGMQFARGPRAP